MYLLGWTTLRMGSMTIPESLVNINLLNWLDWLGKFQFARKSENYQTEMKETKWISPFEVSWRQMALILFQQSFRSDCGINYSVQTLALAVLTSVGYKVPINSSLPGQLWIRWSVWLLNSIIIHIGKYAFILFYSLNSWATLFLFETIWSLRYINLKMDRLRQGRIAGVSLGHSTFQFFWSRNPPPLPPAPMQLHLFQGNVNVGIPREWNSTPSGMDCPIYMDWHYGWIEPVCL